MDYTLENGQYYKVIDAESKIITFGQLSEGEILTTNQNVEFISKDEYLSM